MNRKSDHAKYEPPRTKEGKVPSRAYMIAHFLNWAADHRSGKYFHHNQIAQEIMGLAKLPAKSDAYSKGVQSAMARAKEILLNQFGRGAVADKDGHRACISSEEAVRLDLTPRLRRKVKAEKRIQAICEKGVVVSDLSPADAKFVRKVKQIVQPDALEEAIAQNSKLLGV